MGSEATASPSKLARNTAVYGLGVVISRAASLIMLPVYTRYLSPADYGVMTLLQMTMDVLAIILAQGMGAALFRFYYKATNDLERRDVVSGALWITTGGRLVGSLAAIGCAPLLARLLLDGPHQAELIYIAAASFVLSEFTGIPMLVMQIRQRAELFSTASIGRLLLQLSLNILFVVLLEEGVRGILLSTLLTNLVTGVLLTAWLARQTGLQFRVRSARVLLKFGLPLRLESIGTFFVTFGDRYFLKAFSGLTAVGLYGLAYQFGFILTSMVSKPFLRAWDPERYEIANQEPHVRDEVYNRGFRALSILLVSGAVGISLFAGPFLFLMADPAFAGAVEVVPVIMLAQVFVVWALVVEHGIYIAEKTRYATYATGISVAVAAVSYPVLIAVAGEMGAALATLIIAVTNFGLRYRFSQRLWPLTYQWGTHLRLLGIGVGVVIADVLVGPSANWWLQVAWASSLMCIYLVLVWIGGGLANEDRGWILGRIGWLQRAMQLRRV